MRVLFGRMPRQSLGLIAMQLTLLLMMPSAFKWFEHRGDLTQAHFYLAWWAVGLMLVLFELQEHFQKSGDTAPAARVAHTMRRLYMVLPLASAVAHLSMLHWVYRVHFTAGDLSPVLIGIAFAVGRLPALRPDRVILVRLLAPTAAMIFAVNDPPAIQGHLFGQLGVAPWLLTLAAAYMTWVYCFFRPRALPTASGRRDRGSDCRLRPAALRTKRMVAQRTQDAVIRLIPRTAIEWGLLAMGGAFAFLTFGAALSLRKDADLPLEQAPPPQ